MKTEEETSFTVTEVLEWLERLALADGLLSDDEVVVIRNFADFAGIDADEIIGRMKDREKMTVQKVVAVSPHVIKGIEFENYVFNYLKKIERVNVISRSADYKLGMGRNMDERSLCPDFMVSQCVGKFRVKYWLECKYRSSIETAYLETQQIERFKDVQSAEGHPVFVLMGVGGTPDDPEDIFLMDLDEVVGSPIKELKNGKTVYTPLLEEMSECFIDVCDIDKCILKYFRIK